MYIEVKVWFNENLFWENFKNDVLFEFFWDSLNKKFHILIISILFKNSKFSKQKYNIFFWTKILNSIYWSLIQKNHISYEILKLNLYMV